MNRYNRKTETGMIFFAQRKNEDNLYFPYKMMKYPTRLSDWTRLRIKDDNDESNDKNLPFKTRILTLAIGLHVRWDDSWQPVGPTVEKD